MAVAAAAGEGSGGGGSLPSSMDEEEAPGLSAVAQNWQAWVAVRDAPCPGHPMRFSSEQIRYHYTQDKSLLRQALLQRGLMPRSGSTYGSTPPLAAAATPGRPCAAAPA